MQKSESIKNLATALIAAQTEMPKAKKSEANPFFKSKFAPLHEVMPLALETLNKHGITVVQMVGNIEGGSALTTMLIHNTGEFIAADQPLVLDKENPQGQGSAITYARRYALMSAIGMVADEDDDGNKASIKKSGAPVSVPQKRRASVNQVQMLAQKVQRELKMWDREQVISFLDAAIGKDVSNLMSDEVDEALEKVTKAIRDDKILATMEPEKAPDIEKGEGIDDATKEVIAEKEIDINDIPF